MCCRPAYIIFALARRHLLLVIHHGLFLSYCIFALDIISCYLLSHTVQFINVCIIIFHIHKYEYNNYIFLLKTAIKTEPMLSESISVYLCFHYRSFYLFSKVKQWLTMLFNHFTVTNFLQNQKKIQQCSVQLKQNQIHSRKSHYNQRNETLLKKMLPFAL